MGMKRNPGFLYKLFYNLYEVTIYREDYDPRKFYVQRIKKLNDKHFKAIDENDQLVEYKTTEPFDYFVRRLY